jgi:hypothetical protein
MRDLLNLIDNLLTEASNLAPSEILKHDWRWDLVLKKIKAGEPFMTMANQEVIIDPNEANRFIRLRNANQFSGNIKIKTVGSDGTIGPEIPLSSLQKTVELQKPTGGATMSAGGQQKVSKENALVKPSLIDICDRDIPATDLYSEIVNNPVLNSTDYGKVVINLANYIVSGEAVVLPEEYTTKEMEPLRKAIVDYAGEYLGVLALLYQRSKFDDEAAFLNWLGGSTDDLIIRFPKKANTNIADSYATITNPTTSHSLNISSKGTGGGAAPAISGLKISDDIKRNPKLKNAVDFIEICQSTDRSGGPSTISQAFKAMDLIYQTNPESLPKKFHKFLPFSEKSPDLQARCVDQIKNKDYSSLPRKYDALLSEVESAKATDGGIIVYTIKKYVADAINNKNGIPEFRDTILQVLEMNFIQQYTDYTNGELTFETQWPAKLTGNVSIENKSSAISPTDGGFSFKLGRANNADPLADLGAPGNQDNNEKSTGALDTDDLDAETDRQRLKGPGARAAKAQAAPKTDAATLGRERRRN